MDAQNRSTSLTSFHIPRTEIGILAMQKLHCPTEGEPEIVVQVSCTAIWSYVNHVAPLKQLQPKAATYTLLRGCNIND